MKTFVDAIEACEKVSKHKDKESALIGIHQHHQRLIHEALNNHRRFNVKKWDKPKNYSKVDYPILIPFYELLDKLAERQLTGNSARDAVTKVMSMYTKRTAKYLGRVLRKDLRCGADEKTFRKIYPLIGDDLPDFKVMLAKKMDSKYVWKFPCIAEFKYDGERIVAFVDNKTRKVVYYSRSGRSKDFYCKGLFDKDLLILADLAGQPIVVDGEVLGDSFQETVMARGAKRSEQRNKLRFIAFDYMTAAAWNNRKCNVQQKSRSMYLRDTIRRYNLEKVISSNWVWVGNLSEAKKFYGIAIKQGFEGLIIKQPESLYNWGDHRTWAWTKWKPVYSYDLKIVDTIRGKGKYSNSCGALLLKGKDENGNKIDTEMGSGLTDKDRDFFWEHRYESKGWVVEVEAQGITKANHSDTYALRFPVYKRLREDK